MLAFPEMPVTRTSPRSDVTTKLTPSGTRTSNSASGAGADTATPWPGSARRRGGGGGVDLASAVADTVKRSRGWPAAGWYALNDAAATRTVSVEPGASTPTVVTYGS